MATTTNRDARVLYEIISTVASSLELDEVLRAVVRLLSEASAVHACFVYLREGDALVLQAASDPYTELVGKIRLARGEGLAWTVVEQREPAFIPDNALADPRNKYVPELEEERFQSLLSVPIPGRDGEPIGVVTVHTEAPREFTKAEVDFLVSSATLVAGAIENARLYEDARQRVRELEQITELAEAIARADSLDELLPAVVERARGLLAAEAAHVYLLEAASEELRRAASDPPGAEARASIRLAQLGPELSRRRGGARISVPLVATDELLGVLVAEGSAAVDLARAVASQAAVGIKTVQLIERLTEKNLIKDFFEGLAAGRPLAEVEGRAARLGCDLAHPHVVLAAEPADDAFERLLARLTPGSLFDRREDSLRALLRVPPAGAEALVAAIRRAHAELERPVAVGLSSVCAGVPSFADGFEEARQALLGTSTLKNEPVVMTYEELGAYKYLLRIAVQGGIRDAAVDAVSRLADYDRQGSTSLLHTLEEFLRRRGNISATSEALYVHPNTLRQRLRRISELSGLDLRKDDWLMVEIAVKMVKLRDALGRVEAHTSRP